MSALQCPSCKASLEKMPQRKTKCKVCGEYIFVKSTPNNRENRLMTENQAEAAEKAWAQYHEPNMRPAPLEIYPQFLTKLTADLLKYKQQGFRSVQVFGGSERTCSVCSSLMGKVLPVSMSAEDILRADCERFIEGGYHCAPMVSPVIKDERGNVRFERGSRL